MRGLLSHDGRRLNVLLTEANEPWAQQLPRLLEPQGVRALLAGDVGEALRLIDEEPVHAVVVDLALPMAAATPRQEAGAAESGGGLKLLRFIQRLEPTPPVVVIRGRRFDRRADARVLAEALRLEAFSVLDHPVGLEQMLEVLRRMLERYYGWLWPGAAA